ncbi:hypothetical protein Dimus_016969 [Dionaea muscipula]
MAKPGVVVLGGEATVTPVEAAKELRRELKRLVKVIVEEEDSSLDVIDRAQDALDALRDLKLKRTPASLRGRGGDGVVDGVEDSDGVALSSCPERFRCPLSKQLMRDPVVVATGQTYDRPFIQKWLNSGERTCPQTQQVLSHALLVPNYLIRDMISEWCEKRGIKLPDKIGSVDSDGLTKGDRDHFLLLLEKLTSPLIPEQKAVAAKELRLITKRNPSFRALFGESANAVTKLLSPLSGKEIPPDLHEDLITTLLNVSIHDSNRKLIAETPKAIPLLIDALTRGTIQTRSNAAAALFSLSAVDSNKALIGESGAFGPLLDLLDEGNPLAMNDAASAVFNLCINHENRARAVHEGAVDVILTKIKENSHVDQLLTILAMLSTHPMAVEEMAKQGAIQCLLNVIRETPCERNKENCIAILYSICMSNRTKLRELREEEHAHGTISRLARDGTSRAKRKATSILERLNRAINLTHTA